MDTLASANQVVLPSIGDLRDFLKYEVFILGVEDEKTYKIIVNGGIHDKKILEYIKFFVITNEFLKKNNKRHVVIAHDRILYYYKFITELIERAKSIVSEADILAVLLDKIAIEEKFDFFLCFASVLFERHAIYNDNSLYLDLADIYYVDVRKRNGQIVSWSDAKIENAIIAAFTAFYGEDFDAGRYRSVIDSIVKSVHSKVLALGNAIVDLETIQDFVIYSLLETGLYDIAKEYIRYRATRAEHRMYHNQNKHGIEIIEKNGLSTKYNFEDLEHRYNFAIQGLDLPLKKEEILYYLKIGIPNVIKREDLRKTIIMNAKTMMQFSYKFSYFAARILLTFIYEEVLGWNVFSGVSELRRLHKSKFVKYIKRAVKDGLLDEKILSYDIKYLSKFIEPVYDLEFQYLGIQTLYDRYLISMYDEGENKVRLEVPQFFWMRVAMGIHLNELDLDAQKAHEHVVELYELYAKRLFCSSTPTLFNSGTRRPQLSSCYVYYVDDSIEGIMEMGIAKASYLSKWAGGLGGSWTQVRGTGAIIKGTNGKSNGVIPFLKIHNDMLIAVNQGGKRQGSGAVYLEVWHNDIFDFLELRRNTGDDRRRTHDTNTAVWIPDLFIERVFNREKWTLFRSNEVRDLHEVYGEEFRKRYEYYEEQYRKGKIWGKEIEALELWKQMLRMLYETGHPWMTFKDPCNIRNPQSHVGVIHSSNLCTEITLNTSNEEIAVCNLGSINLEEHVKEDGTIDYDKLKNTIRIAIRALDNVIDINFYPVKEAENSNKKHRPIGLGLMGWHNMLYKMGVDFSSERMIELSDELMEFIAYWAYYYSSELSKERAPYSTFKGSKWDQGILPIDSLEMLAKSRRIPMNINKTKRLDWDSLREKIKKDGMRNSNVLAIAPTATIANIMGTSPSIEPTYSNMYVKSNLSGDFVVINKFMEEDLIKLGLWNKQIIQKIKYYDGDLSKIDEIPEHVAYKYRTAFQIDYRYIIDAAARRQKWIDQSQSLNLFLAEPDMKKLSHMYKYAWLSGLKTTYYLRTLGASTIEKATVEKNEVIAPRACNLNGDGECEACQ